MLHHIATISVCYGGHFESKMTTKIQKSSDLGEIWYYYRHDRVKNWALIISCYVLTLFFIHTISTYIVRLRDICNALRYSNQYFNIYSGFLCEIFLSVDLYQLCKLGIFWLKITFKSFPLKPLNHIKPNLAGIVLG